MTFPLVTTDPGYEELRRELLTWRCAENKFFNVGFYIRPNDQRSFTPSTVYATEREAWEAFLEELA